MHLKICAHRFGRQMLWDGLEKLYHGICEQLIFLDIIGPPSLSEAVTFAVAIYCPFSTTSSFVVAMNFTNQNNGLVVELTTDFTYLSVSWLSDYANESEYLFIQSSYGFRFNNIMHPKSGTEYKIILDAIKIIQRLINGELLTDLAENMKILIIKIIEEQLSHKISSYEPFYSLDDYSKNLINIYFHNVKTITLRGCMTNDYSWFFNFITGSERDWIKLNAYIISILFPNIENILLGDTTLCSALLEDILSSFNIQNTNSKLNRIIIAPNKNDGMHVSCAISKYEQRFKEQQLEITTGPVLTYMCGIRIKGDNVMVRRLTKYIVND
eukprot:416275_1